MDELDSRLRGRLAALSDAVPVSAGPARLTRLSAPMTRAHTSGFSALATAAGVVLIVVLGLLLPGRGAPLPPGASPVPAPTASPAATGAGASTSPSPASAGTPAPSGRATPPPAGVTLPYPDGCAAYGLSPRRCAYIIEWALAQARATTDGAIVQLLGDPGCAGQAAGCIDRTTDFVVRVRVIAPSGEATDHPVFCGVGGETSLRCAELPLIRVGSPMSGYHDVPCGAEPRPGDCATPLATIAPVAAAKGIPLRVPDVTIAIDHVGPYAVDLGDAVLPNGILSEASATLANDRRSDVLIPHGIQLELVGEDGRPLVDAYDHGWRPGAERVHVRLVFTVESYDPGAALEISDVVVR